MSPEDILALAGDHTGLTARVILGRKAAARIAELETERGFWKDQAKIMQINGEFAREARKRIAELEATLRAVMPHLYGRDTTRAIVAQCEVALSDSGVG